MKNWISKLYRNRFFLLFILLFAYVQSIYVRLTAREEINGYTFTPEAALASSFQAGILFVIIFCLIRKRRPTDIFNTRQLLKIFSWALVLYLMAMKASGLLLAFAFDTVERNFNQKTFFYTLLYDFLNGFIYGSFFLAYYYYQKSKSRQHQLAAFHQALLESRIHQLKSQLNPHFLFNNLNVLDQLIEEDKDKASRFLNEFAELYRYVLQSSEKKIVSLHEELVFAEQYFRLVQHKFGKAYQMKIEGKNNRGYVVPLTLQLLIENAIQHNLGTEENPIFIHVRISDSVCVVNNIHPKKSAKPTYGRALINLKEQYKLLTDAPVEILRTGKDFSVIIPNINLSER